MIDARSIQESSRLKKISLRILINSFLSSGFWRNIPNSCSRHETISRIIVSRKRPLTVLKSNQFSYMDMLTRKATFDSEGVCGLVNALKIHHVELLET